MVWRTPEEEEFPVSIEISRSRTEPEKNTYRSLDAQSLEDNIAKKDG